MESQCHLKYANIGFDEGVSIHHTLAFLNILTKTIHFHSVLENLKMLFLYSFNLIFGIKLTPVRRSTDVTV